MKKTIFSVITLCSFLTLFTFESYEQVKENFKHNLFKRQHMLMSSDKYYEFIEPYLQKAEQNLHIVQYCKEKPNFKLRQDYFDLLLEYNVCCFHAYITKSPKLAHWSSKYQKHLFEMIKDIQNNEKLKNLDPKAEYEKTITLFEQANKDFIKKLGWFKNTTFQVSNSNFVVTLRSYLCGFSMLWSSFIKCLNN